MSFWHQQEEFHHLLHKQVYNHKLSNVHKELSFSYLIPVAQQLKYTCFLLQVDRTNPKTPNLFFQV